MPELYSYPRFSLAERDRRWKAVRKKMAEQNIDVIVTPQNTGHSMDFQANTHISPHCGGGGDADIAAVFPLNGDVTAIATTASPRWTTTQDWTADVREARREYGKIIVERLRELKVERGRIGITGLGEVEGTRTPEGTILHGTYERIRKAFLQAEIVDATPILTEVGYVKSQEEIEVLARSMQIVELAYQAEIEAAKPGARDWEVWAAPSTRSCAMGRKCRSTAIGISGKNVRRTLTRPSMRTLELGDLIINEVEASWIGYRSQGVQPVFVGKADPVHQELIKVQRELFNRVLENLKPGATVKEFAELTRQTAAAAAPNSGPAAGARGDLNMHGRGADDDGPIITAQAKSPRQLAVTLQETMVFICKPSAISVDGTSIST
ncbi:MAG TPA: M24 family metallopeptidase [Candidatus Binatia bacterium]